MTSMYRTAYPYFHVSQKVKATELESDYSLTKEELLYIKQNIRGDDLRLGFAILLKVFQRLGYFPLLNAIPNEVIVYVRDQMTFINMATEFGYAHESTFNRHRRRVYDYLGIIRWESKKDKSNNSLFHPGRHHAIKVAYNAAKIMNFNADIINVVVEDLRKNSYELPAFNQLSRLVKHVKSLVNNTIFNDVYLKLSIDEIQSLDAILETSANYNRTGFNELKMLPKNPSISNFKDLIRHHDWLVSMDGLKNHLKDISVVKLLQFAEQSKSLDASDLKNFTAEKRYTLLLSLLVQAQRKSKDALAITFCKTISKIHKRGKEKLEDIKEKSGQKTFDLLSLFADILSDFKDKKLGKKLSQDVMEKINNKGGAAVLYADCEQAIACNSKNYLPLLLAFFESKRATLFKLLRTVNIQSTTQNDALIKAMNVIIENEHKKSEYLTEQISLSFSTESWRKLIIKKDNDKSLFSRRYLEICVFSHLAEQLHSGDVFIQDAGAYSDYRNDLIDWDTCMSMLSDYCVKVNLPNNAKDFVASIKANLIATAAKVDRTYPDIEEFFIDSKGNPILKKRTKKKRSSSAIWLSNEIKKRMPERNIIDILCNTHHYTGWAHIFWPVNDRDTRIDNAIERYIYTNFAYGSGMGPTQAAQHIKSNADITAHMLSWINRRHITAKKLDRARELLINCANTFPLILAWGDGKSCSADGNLRELREENLIAEFHVRYSKTGGIAYHHVANNYIALFSTFIPCGVWEAIAIIEALLQNRSDIQPDTIHADTQGQSTVVFALAYLLGFKLMPRIRNWKDLKLFRPNKNKKYKNIDSLFNDTIKWDLIETHWQDMMQVVLSISAGKVTSALLLRKLGSYSRKNKLYLAFQELGRVIRTQFLLEYISDVEMRETITEETNKVEAYNGLSEWVSFGSRYLVASNDEDEMEKAIKYNSVLTDSIILQNIVDETNILAQLKEEGHLIKIEDAKYLSPYLTGQIKRFGDYMADISIIPRDIAISRSFVLW
jgi:TnpA family transposase